MPELAREQGLSGTVEVRVDLDAKSHITATPVLRSGGSPLLAKSAVERRA